MARSNRDFEYLDCLYGSSTIYAPLADLLRSPTVQRLREIRQSNIDSLDLPGFANCSRFEHALGTCTLTKHVGFFGDLTKRQRLVLQSAALLHDSAISPFGHLVEEAYDYMNLVADHEKRWQMISEGQDASALGGMRLQFYLGRQPGFQEWAAKLEIDNSDEFVRDVFATIVGLGELGSLVCGAMDLDNLDNVVRAAFHAGLRPDINIATRVAQGMESLIDSSVHFAPSAIPDIKRWLELRARLYEQLMFSESDFVGKSMLLWATVNALEKKHFGVSDWKLTDREFINLLVNSRDESASAAKDWMCGDLWPFSGILCFEGRSPANPEVRNLGHLLTESLKRPCFAYRIKDKRTRLLSINITGEGQAALGGGSTKWFLGVVSKIKRPFTKREMSGIVSTIREFWPECFLVENTQKLRISSDAQTEKLNLF